MVDSYLSPNLALNRLTVSEKTRFTNGDVGRWTLVPRHSLCWHSQADLEGYASQFGVRHEWVRQPTSPLGVGIMIGGMPLCWPVAELHRWVGIQKLPGVYRSAQYKTGPKKLITPTLEYTCTHKRIQFAVGDMILRDRKSTLSWIQLPWEIMSS